MSLEAICNRALDDMARWAMEMSDGGMSNAEIAEALRVLGSDLDGLATQHEEMAKETDA